MLYTIKCCIPPNNSRGMYYLKSKIFFSILKFSNILFLFFKRIFFRNVMPELTRTPEHSTTGLNRNRDRNVLTSMVQIQEYTLPDDVFIWEMPWFLKKVRNRNVFKNLPPTLNINRYPQLVLILWIRRLHHGLGFSQNSETPLHADNTSAIQIADWGRLPLYSWSLLRQDHYSSSSGHRPSNCGYLHQSSTSSETSVFCQSIDVVRFTNRKEGGGGVVGVVRT